MILRGDCIEVMKAMKPNSVDAIVTDPPYGLEFMGKEWDKLWDKREFGIDEYSKKSFTCLDGSTRKTNPVSRKLSNPNYKAGIEAQLWHTQWLTEAYRVLKPGASMLVMGGTRTSHRLACAIEDSGFIIKDTIMFLYGSGFPKCQDITPMIDGKILGITTKQVKERRGKIKRQRVDGKATGKKATGLISGCENVEYKTSDIPLTPKAKHWDGFKVGGIKPAYEPIIWAVKPPEGSYVENVLKHGVGAVNVDATRVSYQSNNDKELAHKNALGPIERYKTHKQIYEAGRKSAGFKDTHNSKGRFPANIILSHHPECVQVGVKRVRGSHLDHFCTGGNILNRGAMHKKGKTDPDGLETVESWDCHPDCAVRLLDEQSGKVGGDKRKNKSTYDKGIWGGAKPVQSDALYNDNGGASRFFYCAKASRGERNAGLEGMEEKEKATMEANKEGHFNQKCRVCGKWKNSGSPCKCENPVFYTPNDRPKAVASNNHPTVKPIKLFEWLIKLVTREGQVVLDPFIGSGTTIIAAHNTGRKCVGIEKEEEYIEIAKRRIGYWERQPKQMEIGL